MARGLVNLFPSGAVLAMIGQCCRRRKFTFPTTSILANHQIHSNIHVEEPTCNVPTTTAADPSEYPVDQRDLTTSDQPTMAPSLTQPQGHFAPADALHLAQQAPTILQSNPKALSMSPLSFLFSSPETSDLWTIYENLLLSCLRAGNDEAAHMCLERLILRFGDENERIMAFKGLVKEAVAANHNELEKVLAEYELLLEENGANIVSTA